jgi:hypothetical protein
VLGLRRQGPVGQGQGLGRRAARQRQGGAIGVEVRAARAAIILDAGPRQLAGQEVRGGHAGAVAALGQGGDGARIDRLEANPTGAVGVVAAVVGGAGPGQAGLEAAGRRQGQGRRRAGGDRALACAAAAAREDHQGRRRGQGRPGDDERDHAPAPRRQRHHRRGPLGGSRLDAGLLDRRVLDGRVRDVQRRRRRADLGPQRILAVAELDRGVELGLARRAVGQVGQELVHRGVGQDAVEILIDAAVTAHVDPRDRASRASRSFLRARRIRVPTVDLGTPSAAAMAM